MPFFKDSSKYGAKTCKRGSATILNVSKNENFHHWGGCPQGIEKSIPQLNVHLWIPHSINAPQTHIITNDFVLLSTLSKFLSPRSLTVLISNLTFFLFRPIFLSLFLHNHVSRLFPPSSMQCGHIHIWIFKGSTTNSSSYLLAIVLHFSTLFSHNSDTFFSFSLSLRSIGAKRTLIRKFDFSGHHF